MLTPQSRAVTTNAGEASNVLRTGLITGDLQEWILGDCLASPGQCDAHDLQADKGGAEIMTILRQDVPEADRAVCRSRTEKQESWVDDEFVPLFR